MSDNENKSENISFDFCGTIRYFIDSIDALRTVFYPLSESVCTMISDNYSYRPATIRISG